MTTTGRQFVISAAVQGTIMFVAGLGLLIHEALLPAAEVSWPRLVVFAGMMGGPFAARADVVRAAASRLQTQAARPDDEARFP